MDRSYLIPFNPSTYSPSHSLTHTHTLPHSHTHAPSLTHTHTHSLSPSLFLSLSLTHSLTLSHTHSYVIYQFILSFSLALIPPLTHSISKSLPADHAYGLAVWLTRSFTLLPVIDFMKRNIQKAAKLYTTLGKSRFMKECLTSMCLSFIK